MRVKLKGSMCIDFLCVSITILYCGGWKNCTVFFSMLTDERARSSPKNKAVNLKEAFPKLKPNQMKRNLCFQGFHHLEIGQEKIPTNHHPLGAA